jgi:hypothetical protein
MVELTFKFNPETLDTTRLSDIFITVGHTLGMRGQWTQASAPLGVPNTSTPGSTP